jgi:3-hydroxyisobutyrate dehydrogenase
MVTNGEAEYAVAEQMVDAIPEPAVWVQASTVGAQWADRLRVLADTHHRQMLDVPVSGSTQPAREGKLSWLVAGPRPAVDAARPALEALGERVLQVGAGQEAGRLQLVVNTWMTAATVAMADSLTACDRLGIPRSALLDVVAGGPLAMPSVGGVRRSGRTRSSLVATVDAMWPVLLETIERAFSCTHMARAERSFQR